MGHAFQRSLILADLALTSWTIGRADQALEMAREAAAAADAAGSRRGAFVREQHSAWRSLTGASATG